MAQRSRRGIFLSLMALAALFPSNSAQGSAAKHETTLTIFAASSLSDTFAQIGAIFQRENPSISLRFSFLASSVLSSQLLEGAPADIFAAASERDMIAAGNTVYSSKIFAVNHIVLAFARRTGGPVNSFADLNKHGVKWIQCASSVACGSATNAALKSLGVVKSKPVSYEPKVASAVSKLLEREVDAAFIYHTDYLANRRLLRELFFPDFAASSTSYPIAIVANGKHQAQSKKFIAFLLSSSGKRILSAAGFGKAL